MLPIIFLIHILQLLPITIEGGIAAEWVLVGITTIAFFLFWRMLWKIETGLERVAMSVAVHETRLQISEKTIEDMEEDIKEIRNVKKGR